MEPILDEFKASIAKEPIDPDSGVLMTRIDPDMFDIDNSPFISIPLKEKQIASPISAKTLSRRGSMAPIETPKLSEPFDLGSPLSTRSQKKLNSACSTPRIANKTLSRSESVKSTPRMQKRDKSEPPEHPKSIKKQKQQKKKMVQSVFSFTNEGFKLKKQEITESSKKLSREDSVKRK